MSVQQTRIPLGLGIFHYNVNGRTFWYGNIWQLSTEVKSCFAESNCFNKFLSLYCTEVSAPYTAHLSHEQHILLFIISYIISYYRMSSLQPLQQLYLFLPFHLLFRDARTGRDTCPVIELSLLLSGDVVSNSHFYITTALHIQHDA